MSEITDDYYGDPDVRRVTVKAQPSLLIGSGVNATRYWVLTHNQLPAEMIDSNLSTAEASNAPSLAIATDLAGFNQIGVDVVTFLPAPGGLAGGAVAEINLYVDDADFDYEVPVTLYWNKSGRTQPARDALYGRDSVYNSTHSANWTREDYEDSTANANDGTGTGVGSSSDIPFGAANSWEYGGGSDRVVVPDSASLDKASALTVYGWFKTNGNTGTFQGLIAKRTSFNVVNYSLAFLLTSGDTIDWNYWNGSAFVGLGVTFSTYFNEDEWEFVAGTMEEVGSNVEVKLYNKDGLIGSNTVTSSTLPVNNSILSLGNLNQSSYGFPLDGFMKAWNVLDIALDADQIMTVYNSQAFLDLPGSGATVFWDTSEEVESGPFILPGSGSGSGSGTVPGSGDFDGECYTTIRRDTTFNRLVMWQERSGSVLDVMGHEALAAATPKSSGKYFTGSASARVDGVEEYEFQLIKSDLVKHAKKMMASQCAVHLVAFGFDTHQMWLSDSTLRAIDQRAGGGGMAGAELQLDSQYVSAAVCQVTNILECAPWNSAVAKVDVAAVPGSGSGGASGEGAVYTLKTFKKTSFNGPEWIVDEGDRVTSGGTFKGSLATLSFVFPVGTARFNFVGEWTGTIRQIGWNGGTIQEDAKTAGVDLSVTMDATLWILEIEVTQADERPRMVLQFAGQSQGTRDGVCIECSDPAAVAGGVPPWIIDNEGPIFGIEVGTNKFWTVNQDMTIETETDLDLSAYSIVDICRHQINGFIYGLGEDGKVYRWNGDGTGFEQIFDTGFSDATRINVSTINDKLCIGGHNIAPFNNRFYVYTLAGSALINCEARIGAGSLTGKMECFYHVGSEEWLWIYTSGGSSRFSPIDCGDKSGMQGWSVLEPRQGCIIEPDLIGYRVGGSGIYQFNPVTENNPSNASLVGGGISPSSLANNKLDWWDDDGVRRITGCGEGSRLWSWAFGQGNATLNKTTTEFRALCTRHPYVIP